VARRLLRTTDRAFTLVVSESPIAALMRTRVVARIAAFAMRFQRARRVAFHTLSQIGIRYRTSALSQTLVDVPKAAPQAGDRFPWLHLVFSAGETPEDVFQRMDDTRFNLLIFGDAPVSLPPGLSSSVAAHTFRRDPRNDAALASRQIAWPSFFLVRPDGHIALAGRHLESSQLEAYFADRRIAPHAFPQSVSAG